MKPSDAMHLTFGLDTFGDRNAEDGEPVSHAQTIRDVVEQGVLAEQVGLDFFGIGEHHTDDFPMPRATWSWPRSPREPRASTSARR